MDVCFCAASSLIARSIGFGPQAKIISASRLFSFIASITVPFVPLFPSSVEERMACGIGACLACVCQTKNVDGHSNVHNARVCKDGPVFKAEEVEL